MTENTPLKTSFDLQRRSIEQTREVVEQNAKLQQSIVDSIPDGLNVQRSAQRRVTDLSKRTLHAYTDAVEAAIPETDAGSDESFADVHEAIDEGFDAFEESFDDVWEWYQQVVEENVEAYDEFVDTQLTLAHDSFDAFIEPHEALEEQAREMTELAGEQSED